MASIQYSAFQLSGASFSDGSKLALPASPSTGSVTILGGAGDGILGEGNNSFTFDGATYTYEGTATLHNAQGFVGYNATTGKFYFFTSNASGAVPSGNGDPGLKNVAYPQPGSASGTGEFNTNTGEQGCFVQGTMIATPFGDVAVQNLKAGDLVKTLSGVFRPVRWIGYTVVSRFGADPVAVLPVKISAGALGPATPSRDLFVSPGHAILVEGSLIHASALVNDVTIIQDDAAPIVFTYYHVELDAHDIVLAENAPAESFLDVVGEMDMDNWSERGLLRDSAPSIEMPYPRVKSARQVPHAARKVLSDRALALGVTERVAA